MICPSCTTYYPNGMTTCPECGTTLMEEDEFEEWQETQKPDTEQWVQVYTTNTFIDATMLKDNLESADIPTQILSQIDSSRQLTVGELAIVKVFVRQENAEDALAIIRDIERHSGESSGDY